MFTVAMAASLLFLLLGGVIADRLLRRLVMVGVDGLRTLAVLGLAAHPGACPLDGAHGLDLPCRLG